MRRSTGIRNRRGQGLTEYIIIVALVAIAAIGIVNIFGQQLRAQFATIVAAMAGREQVVKNHAPEARTEAGRKTLGEYVNAPGAD